MTAYFHGTTAKRFKPGQIIKPARKVGRYSNVVMNPNFPVDRLLASGRTVNMHEVVWLTPDPVKAFGWAEHSTLKATGADIRRMAAGGLAVYEVEPVDLDYPDDPHGEGEACCATARVIREVRFEAFALDLCDNCGETATVGLGTDDQLCAHCAEEA